MDLKILPITTAYTADELSGLKQQLGRGLGEGYELLENIRNLSHPRQTTGLEFAQDVANTAKSTAHKLFWNNKRCAVCNIPLRRAGGVVDVDGKSGYGRGITLCYRHAKQFGIKNTTAPTAPITTSSRHKTTKESQVMESQSTFDKRRAADLLRQIQEKLKQTPTDGPDNTEPEVTPKTEETVEPSIWQAIKGGFRSGLAGKKMNYEDWKKYWREHRNDPKNKYRNNWLQRVIGT